MYTVSLSHLTQGGAKKHKAPTLEAAKTLGDVEFSGVKLPRGRNGAGEYKILVEDEHGIVASRLIGEGHAWKDEPRGYQAYPKWIESAGVIVNSLDEEEAVLAKALPAAAAEAPAPAKSRRGATV
jgi:hypothetical protein